MSNSKKLSKSRTNTVINKTSKKQENSFKLVIDAVKSKIEKETSKDLTFKSRVYLKDIVTYMNKVDPGCDYHCNRKDTFISPDGGFLFVSINGNEYPILISEVKVQGTNTTRMESGLKKQAKGNAIERLGKNVSLIKTWLRCEDILPFVVFGYGCDFADGSSILDRAVSINELGKLNTINVFNSGSLKIQRGSFFFRENPFNFEEMFAVCYTVAIKALEYYISKYEK